MATQAQPEPYKPKRTSNACIACRQSKIKCSGVEPCANCQRRAIECQFTDAHKVMVDESNLSFKYLQTLIERARGRQIPPQQQPSPGTKRTGHPLEELPPYQPIGQERSVWTNPFTLPSRTVNGLYKGKSGWIPYRVPSSLDKEVYPLRWRPAPVEDPPDISGLPSIDDALYLFNTVKHHLDQHYRFFDEESFTTRLHEFYSGNSLQKATDNRLWFVHFLLVLAFGNAFLLRSRNTRDPPGSKFFLRAMSLMPDYTNLWTDGLLAVEVLALAGLYLYSIDHRKSAHVYIGQAIRIAQLDGLHTELSEDELGWTLYVMDRHVSSSLGLPMTTQDSDITTPLKPASAGSRRDATLSLHVKLSYLFSSILTSIYKNEKTELGTFLEKTRTILQTMTVYAREIEGIVHPKTTNSVETMPKGTRYITLIPPATRPLLSVLKERLERPGHRVDNWQSFLAPTKALISTGIKSAINTLQIITDENSLLAIQGCSWSQEAHSILDEMVSKGNMLAAARKTELSHLESLFRELAVRIERSGLQALTLSTPTMDQNQNQNHNQHVHNPHSHLNPHHMHEAVVDPTLGSGLDSHEPPDSHSHSHSHLNTNLNTGYGDAQSSPSLPHLASSAELLSEFGISSYEFLSIIEQMGGSESSVLDPGQSWKGGE
ncbi:hypothetical protein BDW62DRAFT_208935 [Aspergillus aurantiobrunneus]